MHDSSQLLCAMAQFTDPYLMIIGNEERYKELVMQEDR